MSNEKHYIGTGRQKAGSQYIILTLRVEDILTADTYDHNGKPYLRVAVAKRMVTNGGPTHSVYALPVEDREEQRQNALADQQEMEALVD